jgi:WD40 repeat protein
LLKGNKSSFIVASIVALTGAVFAADADFQWRTNLYPEGDLTNSRAAMPFYSPNGQTLHVYSAGPVGRSVIRINASNGMDTGITMVPEELEDGTFSSTYTGEHDLTWVNRTRVAKINLVTGAVLGSYPHNLNLIASPRICQNGRIAMITQGEGGEQRIVAYLNADYSVPPITLAHPASVPANASIRDLHWCATGQLRALYAVGTSSAYLATWNGSNGNYMNAAQLNSGSFTGPLQSEDNGTVVLLKPQSEETTMVSFDGSNYSDLLTVQGKIVAVIKTSFGSVVLANIPASGFNPPKARLYLTNPGRTQIRTVTLNSAILNSGAITANGKLALTGWFSGYASVPFNTSLIQLSLGNNPLEEDPTLDWAYLPQGLASNVIHLTISPDESCLVATARNNQLVAYNAETGAQLWRKFDTGSEFSVSEVHAATFSPDSQQILFVARRHMNSGNPFEIVGIRVDRSTGNILGEIPLGIGNRITNIFWLPNGNLVYGHYNKILMVSQTGALLSQVEITHNAGGQVTLHHTLISPDGSKVGYLGQQADRAFAGYVSVNGASLQAGGHALVRGARDHMGWSANSRYLYIMEGYTSQNPTTPGVLRIDTQNIAAEPLLLAQFNKAGAVTVSGNGNLLICSSYLYEMNPSTGHILNAVRLPGEAQRVVSIGGGSKWAVAFGTGNLGVVNAPMNNGTMGNGIIFQGMPGGPNPGLLVLWRVNDGSVSLPTVTIDYAPADWALRSVSQVDNFGLDDLVWQNTDPNYAIPGLVAFWTLDPNGAPVAAGIAGAPGSFNWQIAGITDLDGDQISDLIWVNHSTGQIAAWRRGNQREVSSVVLGGFIPAGFEVRSLAQLTTAHRPYVFTQNPSTGAVVAYPMNETGELLAPVSFGSLPSGQRLVGLGTYSNNQPAMLVFDLSTRNLLFQRVDANGNWIGNAQLIANLPAGWVPVGTGRL